jgi:poly(3-hydroxybutyrate) depolymerase
MLGTEDSLKPWQGNKDQVSADETIRFWKKQSGYSDEGKRRDLPDRDPNDGCQVVEERWEGKAPVVFYTMKGHGHGWSMQRGRDENGTGPKTRDTSAPEEFWAFFEGTHQTSQ